MCYAVLIRSVVSDSLRPHQLLAHQAPLSMEILQARILEWVPPSGDLSNPGIEPSSPALQADSSPSEAPGEPSTMMVYIKYHL